MSSRRAMAEINITPLIDVLLVLLIIFMVVVPVAQRSLDVRVPQRPGPSDGRTPITPTPVLEVGRDAYKVNQEPASVQDLERGLATALASRREANVLIRVVGDVRYERVIEALDAARGAGAGSFGMLPFQEEPGLAQ